jgi:mitochondrial import receptor subunit TOM40
VDNEGTVQGRIHYHFTPKLQSKLQLALSSQPGHSMLQAELDYQGLDFTANLKAVNPSPVDSSGIFVASYLQSITSNLSLGVECVLQKPNSMIEESALSYAARYAHDEGKAISTAQLQAGGVVQVAHWRRIDAMVDAGAEMSVVLGEKREAVCSVGARWEFSSASFRGMFDTKGRVMMVLEERLAPGFAVLMNGELDHWNGKSRFGLGLQMET